jgi:maleamate amidohydrolase
MTSYEERGYGKGSVGFGEKPGIVVVDFQRAFTDPAFPTGGAPMVRRAVENTARLLKVARAAGVPVAACYMGYHSARDAPHWKVGGIGELRDGDPGTELDPLIADPAYDYVLRKGAPSIFFNTPAAAFFAKNRVDTMIVTGCITSGCVRASVVDSFSLGFRTIVPEDCVGDHELGPHQDNLRDVERRYADVSTCDDVIRQIEAWRKRNVAT